MTDGGNQREHTLSGLPLDAQPIASSPRFDRCNLRASLHPKHGRRAELGGNARQRPTRGIECPQAALTIDQNDHGGSSVFRLHGGFQNILRLVQ